MYKKVVLLLLPIFLLFPSVLGDQVCDGYLCLSYNQTYLTGTFNTDVFLDTNDTANEYPAMFFISELSSSDIELYNASLVDVGTTTVSTNPSNYGYSWFNDSGTQKFLGVHNAVGNDYFRQYFLNGTYIVSYLEPDEQGGGCDWYNNNFYCIDSGDTVEQYNHTMDLQTACSYSGLTVSEPHHLETEANRILFLTGDDLDESIVLMNFATCTEMGRIYLGDFASISGISALDPTGVVGNYDDSKVWVYIHYTDATNDVLIEFDVDVNSTESTLTATNPTEADSFTENNLPMTMTLTAGLTGNLTCYIDSTLRYTNTTMTAGTHYVEFTSGDLTDGSHTWFCNFTDSDSNVWEFDDIINFDINTGIGVLIGEDVSDIFGFSDDDYSTSSEKGLAFVALILALALGVGVAITTQSAPMGSIGIMGGLMVFTFIGWLPAWVGIVLIIIAGLIVMKTYQSQF